MLWMQTYQILLTLTLSSMHLTSGHSQYCPGRGRGEGVTPGFAGEVVTGQWRGLGQELWWRVGQHGSLCGQEGEGNKLVTGKLTALI